MYVLPVETTGWMIHDWTYAWQWIIVTWLQKKKIIWLTSNIDMNCREIALDSTIILICYLNLEKYLNDQTFFINMALGKLW